MMKKISYWLGSIVILSLALMLWMVTSKSSPNFSQKKTQAQKEELQGSPEQKMGDDFLATFASEETTGEEDLRLFYDFVMNVFLLIKNRDSVEYAINEDLSRFLRGKNRERIVFLSEGSHLFDENKLIVDRWGTPIHIHTISHDHFELRSGGPDEKLFTKDDLAWPRD